MLIHLLEIENYIHLPRYSSTRIIKTLNNHNSCNQKITCFTILHIHYHNQCSCPKNYNHLSRLQLHICYHVRTEKFINLSELFIYQNYKYTFSIMSGPRNLLIYWVFIYRDSMTYQGPHLSGGVEILEGNLAIISE